MEELVTTPGAIEQIEALARKPFLLDTVEHPFVAVPDGYQLKDIAHILPAPVRKTGTTQIHDADSFIKLCGLQGDPMESVIYINADYEKQSINVTAVFNDHEPGINNSAGWRDHRAVFSPRFTTEWRRWNEQNGKPMSQTEFGFFLEANLADIHDPAGGEVLTFVTTLQETRKVKYGSSVNLANGMVQLEFVEEGNDATKGKLEMFRKFTLGIRPFVGGTAYPLEALLRYRIDRNSGEIKFWFDLQRPDRILEDAINDISDKIRGETGLLCLAGAA